MTDNTNPTELIPSDWQCEQACSVCTALFNYAIYEIYEVNFYLSTLLQLLHQKKLFERKFVLLFNIFLFFNGSASHFTFK
jgi:hypothetical protein